MKKKINTNKHYFEFVLYHTTVLTKCSAFLLYMATFPFSNKIPVIKKELPAEESESQAKEELLTDLKQVKQVQFSTIIEKQ